VADPDPTPPARGAGGLSPLARSPLPTVAPTVVVNGWEVTERTSDAALRLADLSPLAKVHVRAREDGPFAGAIGVRFLHAARDENDVLVTGSGPGEWTLFGSIGAATDIMTRIADVHVDERVTIVDITHGRALVRLTGHTSGELLAQLCAIDLDDRVTPNGSCLRSSVARVVTDIVRDDRGGEPSFLLHCERSSGAYLAARLTEVGDLHDLDIEGFTAATATRWPSR
jgi:heterotetrameric sarcosine oxidase gamma subunit